jgi:hypothetical protein
MRSFLRRLASVIAILASADAHATLVTWTLHDVEFEDGGTASGHFIIDTDAPPPLGFGAGVQINTTPGSLYEGKEHPFISATGQVDFLVGPNSVHVSQFNSDLSFDLILMIDADVQHATHGTFDIIGGSESQTFFNDLLDPSLNASRDVSRGTVTAVPEPSALAFLALPIVIVFAIARRHSEKQWNTARMVGPGR